MARKVGVKVSQPILGKFSNGESKVQLSENVRGQDVYIIQTGWKKLIIGLHKQISTLLVNKGQYMIGFKTSYQKKFLVDTALLEDCKQTK